jgi:hypothetical protein
MQSESGDPATSDAGYRAKAFDPANTKGFAWNPAAGREQTPIIRTADRERGLTEECAGGAVAGRSREWKGYGYAG